MAFLATASTARCTALRSGNSPFGHGHTAKAHFHAGIPTFKKPEPPKVTPRKGRWDEPAKPEAPKAEPKVQAAQPKTAAKVHFADPNPVLPEDTVSARYAQYLWKGSSESGDLHRIESDITKFEAMKSFLSDIFQNTANDGESFLKKYGKVFQTAKISPTFTKFIAVTMTNKKGPKIWDIVNDFKRLLKIARQEHEVVFTTAEPLTEERFKELCSNFTKNSPDYSFNFKRVVDPSILGGIRISYDGEVLFDNNQADKIKKVSERYRELMRQYQRKRYAAADSYLASLRY